MPDPLLSTLHLFTVPALEQTSYLRVAVEPGRSVTAVAYSPDASKVVAARGSMGWVRNDLARYSLRFLREAVGGFMPQAFNVEGGRKSR